MKHILLINILFVSFYLQLGAVDYKPYYFKYLSTEDGLSQSIVSDIIQDNDGFIWFGTYNGLNRYDGKTFKVYKGDKDSAYLSSMFIRKLLVDSKGSLWAATTSSLGRYDKTTDRFIDVSILTGNYKLLNHQVSCIIEDYDGYLWACSSQGLYRINLETYKMEPIFPRIEKPFNVLRIHQLEAAENQTLFLSSFDKVYKLDIITHKMELIGDVAPNHVVTDDGIKFVQKLLMDSEGILWIATKFGDIYTYNQHTDSLSRIVSMPKTARAINIIEESDSTLFCSFEHYGLYRYNKNTQKGEFIYDKNNNERKIQSNKVHSLYIDKQRNLWLGHHQEGISFTQLRSSGFNTVNLNSDDRSVHFPIVSAFIQDGDGNFWVGTDGGGLIKYDNNGNKKLYKHNPSDKKSLPHDAILTLFIDSKKRLWIGSFGGGLCQYLPETDSFKYYKKEERNRFSIPVNDIRKIVEDKNGNLWLAVHGSGLSRFNPETEQFVTYRESAIETHGILNNWTYDLLFDNQEHLWIASTQGVSCLDLETGGFKNYPEVLGGKSGLSNNLVYTLFFDSQHRLWVGTDQGLNKFNFSSKTFTVVDHPLLSAETICSIEEGENGDLWISTRNGLYVYSPKNNIARQYTKKDGLQGEEFIRNSSLKLNDYTLIFGGTKGYSYFKENEIFVNDKIPELKLLKIDLYGEELPASYLMKTFPSFKFNENFLTFHFASLNFINSEKNRYKYKLEGLDENWINSGSENKAIYTSLPPGDYIFRVIASNNSGVWNENGIAYSFKILLPWWQTLWFRSIMFLAGVLLISSFYILRLRAVKKQNLWLEKQVSNRTKEIREANLFLEKINKDVEQKNDQLEKSHSEIQEQNNLLKEKQEEIEAQHVSLAKQQDEILKVNKELTTSNSLLAENKEELTLKNVQLNELVNTKDKMLSIIAHDLKNPMNTLIGFSSFVMGRVSQFPVAKLEKYISLINSSAVHSYNLLENLLTWARSQTGNISVDLQIQDLKPIVGETVQILRESATKKNIDLQINCPSDSICIAPVDTNSFSTVIRNILSNAIKFTPHGGRISIFLGENDDVDDDYYQINISDNGVGMNEEQLQKLFKVENNNSTQGTDNETGTGLGLVICQEFISLNNGKINVESSVGKGTTFQIFIPKSFDV